jgi:hypothetical protein
MASINSTGLRPWRRLLPAAVLATVTALGGVAYTSSATAGAEPKEWDIASYDSCMIYARDRFLTGQTDPQTFKDESRFCCERSGGVWVEGKTTGVDDCAAPAAGPSSSQPSLPGVAPRPGAATQNPSPPPPPFRNPGVVVETTHRL